MQIQKINTYGYIKKPFKANTEKVSRPVLSKEKEKGTMCRLSLTEGKDISIDNDITSIK